LNALELNRTIRKLRGRLRTLGDARRLGRTVFEGIGTERWRMVTVTAQNRYLHCNRIPTFSWGRIQGFRMLLEFYGCQHKQTASKICMTKSSKKCSWSHLNRIGRINFHYRKPLCARPWSLSTSSGFKTRPLILFRDLKPKDYGREGVRLFNN